MVTAVDRAHLRRCVDLAARALDGGNSPFGSALVSEAGDELFAGHNQNADGDDTRHPEFAIARWAAANLAPAERAGAIVYTSGEHCPMCAAAHARVGLGRIIYATSSAQLTSWLADLGVPPGPVRPLPITDIAPDLDVTGPVAEFADEVRELQRRYHQG